MKLPLANCRVPIVREVVGKERLSREPERARPRAQQRSTIARLPIDCVPSAVRALLRPGRARSNRMVHGPVASAIASQAFTLLEVMIAIAIFFVASFAILSLVGSSLDNVRRLQRPSVDASPVLARYAATNSLVEGAYRGSLSDPDLLGKGYRDYNFLVDIEEIRSNHLYKVECVITSANGKRQVISDMSTVLYKPQSPPGSLDGGIGLTGH